MDKNIIIAELQEKAFNGDEQALELYNEHVKRGDAPRINVQFKSSLETMSMMSAGYEAEAEKRGDNLFISPPRELTHEEVMKANAFTKMAYGFAQREQAVAQHKEQRREYRRSLDNPQEKAQAKFEEATQSKTFGEMFKSPFDKISNSYN
ncbi:hypothetical protein OK414_23240 [Priestia sp. JV24]|uniref:hypothetical protein n=1 Tax=Priestia TaxID=2800373 RepID=UPI0021D6988C|nr:MULTISPECIES: hypothetical protein [Priestia]MCU7708341.1 hypothetical protein [Priestia megaterium]MCW1047967.1 hypothetical protein [Priestia sp. JV24]